MAKARQYTEQLTDNQAEQCAVNLTGLKQPTSSKRKDSKHIIRLFTDNYLDNY